MTGLWATTTTISTSPGFTPISSTAAKRGLRHTAVLPRDNAVPTKLFLSEGKAHCSPTQYPTTVSCGELVEVFETATITKTAKETATQTAPTPTITVTTTTTVTSTVYQVDASITESFSITTTTTITTTSTSLTTTR